VVCMMQWLVHSCMGQFESPTCFHASFHHQHSTLHAVGLFDLLPLSVWSPSGVDPCLLSAVATVGSLSVLLLSLNFALACRPVG